MLNYYDVIAKQDRADHIASVGFRISAAAKREVSEEAVARHLNQQHHNQQEETKAARRVAIADFTNAVKAIFRNRTVLVR